MTKVGIPDGAFALGTFAAGEAISFPGLVHADGRVVDVSQSWTTLHDVLQAGANFRRHVIDMVVGGQYEREPGQSLEDLRSKAAQPLRRPALAVLADVEAELAGQLGRVRDLGQKLGSQRP